ncbi:MAG: PhoH family protein [Phycisphaerae bacterium]
MSITLEQPRMARKLFGPADRHLRMIREATGAQIFTRGQEVKLTGSSRNVSRAASILEILQRKLRGNDFSTDTVASAISTVAAQAAERSSDTLDVFMPGKIIRAKTPGQKRYFEAMSECDLTFCTGPAGTGKTYLAVAKAVHLLKHEKARRLILVRPAVEAGEKLGFLPGDMQAKVNPYLRPLFDALHDMMEYDAIRRFMVNDVIEVIPLAFMRGRTLNDSVIILDEAQNTTAMQMLMFLTRMGHGAKMIVTGDESQVDLEGGVANGLADARRRLSGIKGIGFVRLDAADIVRHRLVQNIVNAYSKDETRG